MVTLNEKLLGVSLLLCAVGPFGVGSPSLAQESGNSLPAEEIQAVDQNSNGAVQSGDALPTQVDQIQTIEEAVNQARTLFDSLLTVADRQAYNEALEQIDAIIERAESIDLQTPWLDYVKGRANVYRGQRPDAVQQLRRFVETREGRNEWSAHAALGDIFSEKFPRLAKASYAKALDLNPGEPAVLLGLSVCELKLGYQDSAFDYARQAITADRDQDPRYPSQMAQVLIAQNKLEEAQAEATRALELAKQQMQRQPQLRAKTELVSTQHEFLISIIKARIEKTPKNAELYLQFVDQRESHNRIAQRLARFNTLSTLRKGVTATAPDTPTTILERFAVTLAHLDHTDEAVSTFQDILAADPGNTTAIEWLGKLQDQPKVHPQ